ncbi:DUF3885 domain-containing protein [Altererythrobacter indicus]|uniref:DUF3885 domain-containing protein n=1 Tax=Altericroceibacterium indicum TaxID=374177 RepID=A0A845ACY4_9SPHN|nr:DUF3885 domain-containing protein [Altericroceibacterium indicum]MXP26396.1 DUF3885 domain-containing protein [Altericroceibacterium indicum]
MILSLEPNWQRELWASPYRLRFELCDGDHVGRYLTKFTRSFDRARCLARMALPTDSVTGIIGAFPHPSMVMNAQQYGWTTETGFEQLSELGVSCEAALGSWSGFWWPGDEADPEAEQWVQRAVSLTWDEADIFLWNQIALDLGVEPRAPVLTKLVDLERGVCVNAYDDRGMDITALTKEPLVELYSQFNSWLLDDDRNRMAAVFES